MSKEYLEALKTIKIKCHPNSNPSPLVDEALKIVEQALQLLESIDNAKPSEALESLDRILHCNDDDYTQGYFNHDVNIVKQALLKAQEQEKENAKYKQLKEQLGCPLKIRCKVVCDSYVYDENGIKYKVIYVYGEHFDCEDPFDNDMGYTKMCAFDWKDYKKTWSLREDKSE